MSSFPQLADPLTDGRVVLRDYKERDIPEILIAYQDDPRLHVSSGEDRPPTGAELGSRAEREAALRAAGEGVTLTVLEPQLRHLPRADPRSRRRLGPPSRRS